MVLEPVTAINSALYCLGLLGVLAARFLAGIPAIASAGRCIRWHAQRVLPAGTTSRDYQNIHLVCVVEIEVVAKVSRYD
jgi:hypothetical protein